MTFDTLCEIYNALREEFDRSLEMKLEAESKKERFSGKMYEQRDKKVEPTEEYKSLLDEYKKSSKRFEKIDSALREFKNHDFR